MISARRSGAEIEQQIITGMIVSTPYLKRVTKIYRPELLQVEYAPVLARWCLEYFQAYQQAPEERIEDLFKARKKELKNGHDVLAETFLKRISREHERQESFNDEYLFTKTRNYFHQRALLVLADRIETAAIDGKLGEAEQAIRGFSKIVSDISPWINPMAENFITGVFENREANQILRFPGAVGKLLGPLERGWLVGILGPMKRGKTFWLYEMGFVAAMQKLRVAIFSLEMNAITNGLRIFKRMTALPDFPGPIRYPVFDCANNQDGSCTMAERLRVNDVPLYREGEEFKPKFNPNMDYRPCTWCRDHKDQFGPNAPRGPENPYLTETWYKLTPQTESLNLEAIRRKRRQFISQYGDRMRLRIYPAYSASLEEVESDLDVLEFSEGFVPDVIIVDYADILMPVDKRLIDRSALDSIWKGLKGLAEKRNCLVVTASQTTRKAIDKASVKQTDTAEDIRKLAHVDAMFGLNQTEAEKQAMVMRINALAHRHRFFTDGEVQVLSQLSLGLPCLDSEFFYSKTQEE